MSRKLKKSVLADEDLIQSFIYGLETWGIEQAESYKNELKKGLDKICENPFLTNSKKRDELVLGCRSYRIRNYYVFYKVSEDDTMILVARVLHESMNIPDHLRSEYFPVSLA